MKVKTEELLRGEPRRRDAPQEKAARVVWRGGGRKAAGRKKDKDKRKRNG